MLYQEPKGDGNVLRSLVTRSLVGVGGVGLGIALAAAPVSAARHHADAHGAGTPPIYVDGQKVRVPAFIDRRRVFVPVRGVFEAIGAIVTYSAPHFVVVRKDGAIVAAFIVDRPHAIVGHRAVDLDAAPLRRDGRIYVPLRLVAEAAGASVGYAGRPPVVHISRSTSLAAASPSPEVVAAERAVEASRTATTAQWRLGVAVVTGLCCLGCVALTARRFAPSVFRPRPRPALRAPELAVEPQSGVEALPVTEQVAFSSVEATGEASFRKELVTETRTVAVPVTREELVIEYTGEGGSVIIEGRELTAGETVRIPLWEERVQVDVIKHQLLRGDIVVAKRRTVAPAGSPDVPPMVAAHRSPAPPAPPALSPRPAAEASAAERGAVPPTAGDAESDDVTVAEGSPS